MSQITNNEIKDATLTNSKLSTTAGELGGAWTSFNSTVTSETGSITSYTAPGYYTTIGKTLHFSLLITITNKGTGAGALIFTLPVNAKNANWGAGGRENGVSGATFSITGSTLNASLFKYDNTTLIATNASFRISGTYEAA